MCGALNVLLRCERSLPYMCAVLYKLVFFLRPDSHRHIVVSSRQLFCCLDVVVFALLPPIAFAYFSDLLFRNNRFQYLYPACTYSNDLSVITTSRSTFDRYWLGLIRH